MHRLLLLAFGLGACGPSPDPAPADPPPTTLPDTPALRNPEDVPFKPGGLENGDYATEIALPDGRTGTDFTLSAHLGPARRHPTRAAIVAFSASWCGPCQASLPQLAELKEEYGDELLVVIASIDDADAGFRREVAAVERAGLDAPVVRAPEALQRAWLGDRRNVPHLFILNQIGEVLVQDRGYGDNVRGMLPRQVAYAHGHPEYVPR